MFQFVLSVSSRGRGGKGGAANTKTDSNPHKVGLSREGKTMPSVDLAPLAAADDLMVLF